MENNTIKAYSLEEISKWQNEEQSSIQLPSLQRGFVWKPHQIENLWDSILRGYPIGAILMSIDDDNNRFLLDGQQRCTSIALGFFDPFEDANNTRYFSLKDYLPSIWIDLKPNTKNENKFLIRVLTKSHPWGYQIQRENSGTGKTLSMANRRKAYEYFKSNEDINYINLKSSNINPWDASFPVPLSWLLSLVPATFESFVSKLKLKLKDLKIRTINSESNEVDFESITNDDLKDIYEGVKNAKNILIPEITVDAKLLKDNDDELSEESQNPTLFVRVNSAGTNISGEELIYSVYKAAFPEVKDLVEHIGASYIAPSKVINLISRLAYCEINGYKNFPPNFTVNSFRKEIKTNEFKVKLESYIIKDDASKLIETAKLILNQNEIGLNELSIPPILLKQFIISSADLFLVLLIFIKQNKLHEKALDRILIKEISSSYVQLLWFSYEISKTPSQLFKQLFIENKSWTEAVNEMVNENQVVPLVKPQTLRENLINVVVNERLHFDEFEKIKQTNILNDIIKKELVFAPESILDNDKSDEEKLIELKRIEDLLMDRWNKHVNKIFNNRSLLIYSQRKYFSDKFKDFNQLESMEDTNRPWDWDHIYPKSWVDNLHYIHHLVKRWVNSNGNFRALSYDDNRSESNNLSPADRLNSENIRRDSFISESDFESFWGELGYESKAIKYDDEVSIKIYLSAVVNRTVNIYEEWYNNYYS